MILLKTPSHLIINTLVFFINVISLYTWNCFSKTKIIKLESFIFVKDYKKNER